MSGPWYEDDALWEDLLAVLFPERRVGATAGEVAGVLALAGLAPSPSPATDRAAVLDLACGIGRRSLELARRGFRVTGVDRRRL